MLPEILACKFNMEILDAEMGPANSLQLRRITASILKDLILI